MDLYRLGNNIHPQGEKKTARMEEVLTESRDRKIKKRKRKEIFSTKDNYNEKENPEKPE